MSSQLECQRQSKPVNQFTNEQHNFRVKIPFVGKNWYRGSDGETTVNNNGYINRIESKQANERATTTMTTKRNRTPPVRCPWENLFHVFYVYAPHSLTCHHSFVRLRLAVESILVSVCRFAASIARS